MAYETRYQLPFASPYNSGDIYIKELDYSGGITTLRLVHDGLEIINDFQSWDEPIIRQRAVITFINDAADFFEYIDLFELEEREFKC